MYELTEDSAEQLRHLLSHAAWNGFFRAHLDQWRQDGIASLLDPSEERRRTYSDDYLRAYVAIIDSILKIGPAELAAWDAEHEAAAERRAAEQRYDDAADQGVYRPLP